jgi:hypothetical protein
MRNRALFEQLNKWTISYLSVISHVFAASVSDRGESATAINSPSCGFHSLLHFVNQIVTCSKVIISMHETDVFRDLISDLGCRKPSIISVSVEIFDRPMCCAHDRTISLHLHKFLLFSIAPLEGSAVRLKLYCSDLQVMN